MKQYLTSDENNLHFDVSVRPVRLQNNSRSVLFYVFILLYITNGFDNFFEHLMKSDKSALDSGFFAYLHYVVDVLFILLVAVRFTRVFTLLLSKKLLLIFILVAICTVFVSNNLQLSAFRIFVYCCTVLSVAYIVTSLEQEELADSVIKFMAFSIFVSFILCMLLPQFFVHQADEFPRISAPGAWKGLYPTKNNLGHCAGIFTGCLLCYGKRYFKNKSFLVISIFSGLICVVFSRSTSGAFLLAAISVYSLVSSKIRSPKSVAISGILALIFGLVFVIFWGDILDILTKASGKDSTFSGRTAIWQYSYAFVARSWITGMGYGYTASPEFIFSIEKALGVPNCHNAYLEMTVNCGIFGAFFFALTFIRPLVRALRSPSKYFKFHANKLFCAFLVGWCFSGLTESDAAQISGPLVIIGLIAVFSLEPAKQAALEVTSELGRLKQTTLVASRRPSAAF